MYSKTALLCLFAGVFSSAVATTAEEKAEQAGYLFDKLDSNNDGKISLDEAKAFYKRIGLSDLQISQAFKNADTNGNGFVSKEEFENYASDIELPSKEDLLTAIFDKIDSDNNNYITLPELTKFYTALGMKASDVATLFKEMDKDGSGKVSLSEFKANSN